MSMRQWLVRLLSISRKEQIHSELNAEIEDHLEEATREYEASGMAPAAARRAARRRFGRVGEIKEQYREQSGVPSVESLWWDLRCGARRLLKRPGFTVTAICSLAIGIGANTAIFSIVDSLLLKPLPVEHPEQIVLVRPTALQGTFWDGRLDTRVPAWTNPLWEQIHQHASAFETVFAFSPTRFNLADRGPTDFVEGIWVSGGYFDALGVPPVLGRAFTSEDDRPGGGANGPVAVISYDMWQRRYGGSPDVLGKTLRIDRVAFTVVGVMPARFFGTAVGGRFDVAAPLAAERLIRREGSRLDNQRARWVRVLARMKDGQTLAAAEEALRVAQPRIREASLESGARPRNKERYLAEPFALQSAAGGTSSVRARYGQPLVMVMAIVGLVLLIACANIANLLLADAALRRHELSVRRAMGASRWRVARQLLVESLLLAGGGAVGGLAVAYLGSRLLVQQLSTHRNTIFLDVSLDWRVLGFTAAVALTTALLFGLAPTLRASGAQPIESMRDHGRGAAARHGGIGSFLIAGQVAFSFVLVVAAGLFIGTLATLTTKDLGFERDPVLLTHLDLQGSEIADDRRLQIYQRVEEAVQSIPGVMQAAFSSITPVSGRVFDVTVEIENGAPIEGRAVAYINALTSGWFATYGTPLVAGRDFEPTDRSESAPVAIVNEAFVRKFLLETDPIGKRVRNPQASARERADWMEIVGVASDATYVSVRDEPPPTLYVPIAQQPEVEPSMTLAVRVEGNDPSLTAGSVGEAIRQIDPKIAFTHTPLSIQVDAALVRERILAILSGLFGAVALLLAGLGLYGVTTYAVNARRAEIGIRIALGAKPDQVVRLVLARVFRVVGIGILVGLAASIWLAKFIGPLLYGLQPADPATFALSAAVLIAVTTLAGWRPARRATQVDPAEVLRET